MLIAISGRKHHGKSSIATMIRAIDSLSTGVPNHNNFILQPWEHVLYNREVPPGRFMLKKFADTLKDMTCLLLRCTRKQLEDSIFKETPLGPEWNKYSVDFFIENCEKCFEEGKIFATLAEAEAYKQDIENWVINHKGFDLDHIEINEIKMTPRLILQLIGTEFGRDLIHPNIWVNNLFINYSKHSDWIIDDLRFKNEAVAIKERGGKIIRIVNPNVDSSNETHRSEFELDGYDQFDYFIINDGNLEDLQKEVEKICTDLGIISQAYYNNTFNSF